MLQKSFSIDNKQERSQLLEEGGSEGGSVNISAQRITGYSKAERKRRELLQTTVWKKKTKQKRIKWSKWRHHGNIHLDDIYIYI